MDDGKKISFGFSKITKKPNLLPNKKPTHIENTKELIKCLEGQEIKLITENVAAAPLIITMKENQKTSTALASLMKRRAVLLGEEEEEKEPIAAIEPVVQTQKQTINDTQLESLEQRAVRELLATAQTNGPDVDNGSLVLPILKPDELPLDGAKESTLDDYDNIPIQQFGLAMLRGMGWIEPPKQQKNANSLMEDTNFVRPKGMGLGADKAIKAKPLLVQPQKNEILEIKKLAYVRILGGKHKELYGQIEGFDDHAGRVIVKMAIGGVKEAFNEFLCQPVSKQEYAQYGKCINTTKYEEYKKMENEYGQIVIKKDEKAQPHKVKSEKNDNRRYDDYKEYNVKKEQKYFEKTREYERTEQKYYDERKLKQENSNRHYGDDDDDDKDKDNNEHKRCHNKYNENKYAASGSSCSSSSNNRYKSEQNRISDYRNSDRSSSNNTRAPTIINERNSATDDTDDSSDSDSTAERKYKKKSSKKKSTKSKHKKQRNNSTDASSDESAHKRHRKKKTKSSRKRSRSRSRDRRR